MFLFTGSVRGGERLPHLTIIDARRRDSARRAGGRDEPNVVICGDARRHLSAAMLKRALVWALWFGAEIKVACLAQQRPPTVWGHDK
jgi:hypothetical protein